MGAMVWWLIPVAATILAVVWVTWINRPRRPIKTHESLAEHERFKQAMQRVEPQQPPQSSQVPPESAA